MRILVAIPSYHNPAGLIAAVKNLHDIAYSPSDIVFKIGVDEDDFLNKTALAYLSGHNISATYYKKDIPHSDMWNELCKDEADFYVLHNDDSVCVSPHWDKVLAETDKNVLFWQVVNNPYSAGPCIISDGWLKAAGCAFVPYFPFWFGDTWLDELRAFVTGEDSDVEENLCLYIPVGKTTGIMDLDFWWGFFNATRPLRIAEAYKVFMALGKAHLSHVQFNQRAEQMCRLMRLRDTEHRKMIPELESSFDEAGDKKLARHARCRKIADELMAKNNLKLWGDL
jgi:hypothetical protein